MDTTQKTTQISQGSIPSKQSIGDFIKGMGKVADRFRTGTSTENDELKKKKILDAMVQKDGTRVKRTFDHCLERVADDGSELAARACQALLTLMEGTLEAEGMRCRCLSHLLPHLLSPHLSVPSFVSIYNIFLIQTERMQAKHLVELCDSVTQKVQECEANVTVRWRDCMAVVLRRLLEHANVDVEAEGTGAAVAVRLCRQWLVNSTHHPLFQHLVALVKACGLDHVVESFTREDVQTALDGFNSLNEDDKRCWSMKWIELMERGDEKEEKEGRLRKLRSLLTVWPLPKGDNCPPPSSALSQVILLFTHSLQQQPLLAKTFASLFKMEQSRVMESEFGFLGSLALCCVERQRRAMESELAKAVIHLFSLEEEAKSIGWLRESFPSLLEIFEQQVERARARLCDPAMWRVLAEPLLQLSYALLETSQAGKLSFTEGRICDGPRCWLFSSSCLRHLLDAAPSPLAPFLLRLIHAVSSASSPSSALVLIDVLLEVVVSRSVEVLNSWSELMAVPEYVCRTLPDVAVSLVRSLLPIMHHRPQLRTALFRVLKKDVLCEATVSSAVPLLLLLFRSLSSSTKSKQLLFSQSFATFSSQSLAGMGCTRSRDDSLCLEIVGALRRCLCQPGPTRAAVCIGVAEACSRNDAIVEPCMDLLLSHAASLPSAWTVDSFVVSTNWLTQLCEPVPHLALALHRLYQEMMCCDRESGSRDVLLSKASAILRGWAEKAAAADVHDLSIDKLSEWNRATSAGRANLLFAHSILSLYDVLLEHLWQRVHAVKESKDIDLMNSILKRRNQVKEVLGEAVVRRKNTTKEAIKAPTLNIKQTEVDTSSATLSEVLSCLIGEGVPVGVEGADLLEWGVERTLSLAISLCSTAAHSLHGQTASTSSLISICRHLLLLFAGGAECAEWLRGVEGEDCIKTTAIQAYSSLLSHLLCRYSTNIAKISPIWSNPGEEEAGGRNGLLMKHVHILLTKLLPAVLILCKEEGKEKRKGELEKQAASLLQAAGSLLAATSSPKAPLTVFKFLVNLLQKNSFGGGILREVLRTLTSVALRCSADDAGTVDRTLISLADQLVAALRNEMLEDTFDCVCPVSAAPIAESLFSLVEKQLEVMMRATSFSSHFSADDIKLNRCLETVITRSLACTRLLTRLLPLYTQFGMQKQKLTLLLTHYFRTVDLLVKALLEYGCRLRGWSSSDCLARLMPFLAGLLAEVDENVGVLHPEEESSKSSKMRYAKSKKDETTYVKYVRARESCQGTILLFSKAVDDKRFNLQVKNNSIGLRDFRINIKTLTERLKRGAAEMDETASPAQPSRKKKRTPS